MDPITDTQRVAPVPRNGNGKNIKLIGAIVAALLFGPSAGVGVSKLWPGNGKACPAHVELTKRVASIELNRFTDLDGEKLESEVVALTIKDKVGDEKHKQVLARLSSVEISLVNLTAAIRALEQKVNTP